MSDIREDLAVGLEEVKRGMEKIYGVRAFDPPKPYIVSPDLYDWIKEVKNDSDQRTDQ